MDAAVDYPRRRATIAVRLKQFMRLTRALSLTMRSVRSVAQGNRAATEQSQSASFVLNWVLNASTASQASS